MILAEWREEKLKLSGGHIDILTEENSNESRGKLGDRLDVVDLAEKRALVDEWKAAKRKKELDDKVFIYFTT
jgi:hypothetical protein